MGPISDLNMSSSQHPREADLDFGDRTSGEVVHLRARWISGEPREGLGGLQLDH